MSKPIKMLNNGNAHISKLIRVPGREGKSSGLRYSKWKSFSNNHFFHFRSTEDATIFAIEWSPAKKIYTSNNDNCLNMNKCIVYCLKNHLSQLAV